ncbi:biotin/lipoyl-containing protein, partial [Achromobacter insolitus]
MGALNDLLMPKLGLTMTEGMLIEWSVAAGDEVKAGDPLFVVETDKVANEISAEADGLIGEILVQAGETVPVGAVVARWTGPGQSADLESNVVAEDETASAPVQSGATLAEPASGGGRIVATPLARRLARELEVDLASVGG